MIEELEVRKVQALEKLVELLSPLVVARGVGGQITLAGSTVSGTISYPGQESMFVPITLPTPQKPLTPNDVPFLYRKEVRDGLECHGLNKMQYKRLCYSLKCVHGQYPKPDDVEKLSEIEARYVLDGDSNAS